MMNRPKAGTGYGVVIPAFNAATTIGEAILSALRQTQGPAEVVVVDDGSSDETRRVAEKVDPRVRVLHQKNAGAGAATTLGMAKSRCPVIALLDADDVWLPFKMERQLAWLDEHEGSDGIFAGLVLIGDSPLAGEIREGWVRSTMVIRRRVFDGVGAVVDPPGRRGEMVDWIARAREAGFQLDMLKEPLVRRRITPSSLSYGRDPQKDAGYLHVARQALLRKRQARKGGP
jgi:glycosyltransferase involved in cell wall biosynthesis